MNNSGKIILGVAVGALAGAVTGLLLAPESGPQTRRKITKESEKFRDSLSQSINEVLDAAKSRYNTLVTDSKAKYNNAVLETAESGKRAAENVKRSATIS